MKLEIVLLICLLILSIQDIYRKAVSVKILAACFAIIIFARVFLAIQGGITFWELMQQILWGVVPGILIGIFGAFTHCVGVGDGVVMVLIGVATNAMVATIVFTLALTLMAICTGVLLIFKKVHKKQELPLVPWISMVTMGVLICI